ncbi:MAG: HD domain-containing protein [Anaerolineae bacterium]|nr:HD domain-containing protein [Anaerolineae bacterium]MBT7073655.1 HD domain-containing protein [Anaerolineae bacterium]MBT7782952.1 HD domain-containing protein [Anaerolineae bacterium]
MTSSQQNSSETLLILAIIALGAFVLGIASFKQPLLNKIETPVSYNQQAFFRYTANVPEGIYDSPQVQSGEPIFRQLNESFTVTMDYLFLSLNPNSINGTYHFLARVSDDRGWKRTLELIPETSFTGNVFTASGILNLDDIQAFIDTLERETGVQRGRYSLSILADIDIQGSLAELDLADTFNPSLNFQIDELEVRLSQNNTGENNILSPNLESAISRVTYEKNHLNIFGMQISISFARWVSVLLGIPALIMLFISLFHIFQATQQNELERLRVWYGSMLIEARDTQLLMKPDRVEIASLDDLANLAEQDQRTILHLPENDQHHFFVQTAEQLYHYEMEETSTPLAIIQAKEEKKNKAKWQLPFLKKRNDKVWAAYEHALKGWANAVDNKLYTQGQADQIAEMAYELARALGIHDTELEEIRMAAYLHKIGLMNIPQEVLDKKKKLTQAELELIRNHPAYAHDQLDGIELLKPIAEIIYYQHERWDGSGHPEGLEKEEIPIGARIIAIVNIWNALQQSRPYRDAWEYEKSCQYFREQAGHQFDPEITNVFLNVVLGDKNLIRENNAEENIILVEGE